MKLPDVRSLATLACLASVAFPSLASAQDETLVYRETFSTTVRATYASMGWSFYYNNATATPPVARNGATATTSTAVSEGLHNSLSSSTNVGQAVTAGNATNGVAFFNTTGGTNYFGFTEEYDGTGGVITTSNLSKIAFLNQSETAWDMRAAIRVDDNWYVTDAKAGYMTPGTFDQNAVWIEFDNLSNITWTALNFEPGVALAPGDTGIVLASGATVTAFGFFGSYAGAPVASTSNRIDDFSVHTIPEPSSFAAFAGLGALGMVMSRRRRK